VLEELLQGIRSPVTTVEPTSMEKVPAVVGDQPELTGSAICMNGMLSGFVPSRMTGVGCVFHPRRVAAFQTPAARIGATLVAPAGN
jgi:hypothetical protein